jgi:hypothetical protein
MDFRTRELRTSLVVLLAGLLGFALGAALLGFVALSIGISLLGRAKGGIHSDWTLAVLLETMVCIGLGGVAGAKGAVHLVRSWHGEKE